MKKISFLILLVISISCKTVSIKKQPQRIASSAIELGTIGVLKPNLEINAFQTVGIPKYKEKIRVQFSIFPYNKLTFNALKKASKLQGKKVTLQYVDSLPNKPTYVTFTIADKVAIIQQLKSEENSTIIEHLKIAPTSKLVTTVSINFDSTIIKNINQAEEIYLVNTKHKKYHLALYKNSVLFKTVEFSKGVVFAYKIVSFCWGENSRHQPILVNITGENSKCSKNTYNSYQQVEKKKYSIKY